MGAAMFDARRCPLAAVPFLNDLASQAGVAIELYFGLLWSADLSQSPDVCLIFFQGRGPEAVTGRQDETMP